MIPIWLQLVTAVSAGLVSGLLGIALVPFLQKLRFYPPAPPEQEGSERAGEERKPIMGGLLLLAGMVFAFVLGAALYLQFADPDRTAFAFSGQIGFLKGIGIDLGFLAGMGLIMDWMTTRGTYKPAYWDWVIPGIAWAGAAGAMEFGYTPASRWEMFLEVVIVFAVPLLVMLRCDLERNTDGALLPVNAIELLCVTILLLRESLTMPALVTLAAAGACFGTMVWCLHPAKCRIGRTGTFVLAGLSPMLCILSHSWKTLALLSAVYVLQQLYRLHRREGKLMTEAMEEGGIQPLQRILILAGITAFCGVLALLLKTT